MSLYNMVCGNNPLFEILHAVIDLPQTSVQRWRDVYTHRTDDGTMRIIVYTRTGGGNREGYLSHIEKMQAHPFFERDWDEPNDKTFAHFSFRVPPQFEERVSQIHNIFSRCDKGTDPQTKTSRALASMDESKTVERPPRPSYEEMVKLESLVTSLIDELGLTPASA